MSDQDWKDLEEMVTLLEPFKIVTMLGQQKGTTYGSIGSTLWGFDYLLAKLEKCEKDCKRSDTGFRTAVNLSWKLLTKYYKETDKCPVYIVAMTLDPRFKFQYFERKWKKEWLEVARQKLCAFYNQYRQEEEDIQVAESIAARKVTKAPKSLDISEFLWGASTEAQRDELEEYCNDPVLRFSSDEKRKEFDVMEYWKVNVKVYPTLA